MGKATAGTEARLVEQLLAVVPGDIDAFRALCSSVPDWARAIDCAREQGVLAVLLHYVRDANVEIPGSLLQAARRHCTIEQLWTSQVASALAEALPRLNAEGIKGVALKGPVLAERLYPDAALRPCIDLDLLVDAGQLEAANTVLEALGYRGQTGPGADYARAYEHHVHFERPNTPTVELHFRLYAGFGTALGARDALDRATIVRTAAGAPVGVLAPEDEVLYLALHATGHSYVRLLWLYDLKLMLRQFANLDWALVADRAQRSGVLSAVAFTCEVLRDRLGVPAPSASQLGMSPGMRWRFARRLLPTVMKPTARSAWENLESLVFTSLLCDRWSAGFRLVRHHAMRGLKRRVHRVAPVLVPEDWSA